MDEDLLSETAPERIAGLSDERLEELYNELSGLPDHPSNLIRILRQRAQLLGEERARRETERGHQEQIEKTHSDTVHEEQRHKQIMFWTKLIAALTAAGVLVAIITLCHPSSPPSSPAPNHDESTANPASEYSVPVNPTQTPVSTPTETPVSTPPRIVHISPSKMIREVAAARPLQREEIGKQFTGLAVDWYLYFHDGRERGDEYFLVFSESRGGSVVADGSVLKSDYPALHLTEKGTRMHVRAIVEYVTDGVVVLEQISISE
jgi:hypothetical protein